MLTSDFKMTTPPSTVAPPKPSEREFGKAAAILCSVMPNKTTMCETGHMNELLRSCAATARCMFALVSRLMRCPGLVSCERYVKLSRLIYMHVKDDLTFNLPDACIALAL